MDGRDDEVINTINSVKNTFWASNWIYFKLTFK